MICKINYDDQGLAGKGDIDEMSDKDECVRSWAAGRVEKT